MTDIEIQKAAEEIFKDSEYPVPNTYCFIKGAKWAPFPIANELRRMNDREDRKEDTTC